MEPGGGEPCVAGMEKDGTEVPAVYAPVVV